MLRLQLNKLQNVPWLNLGLGGGVGWGGAMPYGSVNVRGGGVGDYAEGFFQGVRKNKCRIVEVFITSYWV